MTAGTASLTSTPVAERFERFPPPLHRHLATIDTHNARIKLFGVTADAVAEPGAQDILRRRFEENALVTKLTAYAPAGATAEWRSLGFNREGRIGRFFRDGRDAVLWVRYSSDSRAVSDSEDEEEKVLDIALSKEPVENPLLPGEFNLRFAGPDDADRISDLLQKTFSDYPADTSPAIIHRLMIRQELVFALVEHNGEIASMASGEIDLGWKTAEISDCVTAPGHRGRGLMVALLDRLVDHVSSRFKITDFYSLARAREIGMNAALARVGFTHDGRLVNNCRMPTGWETMNVWWRTVADDA